MERTWRTRQRACPACHHQAQHPLQWSQVCCGTYACVHGTDLRKSAWGRQEEVAVVLCALCVLVELCARSQATWEHFEFRLGDTSVLLRRRCAIMAWMWVEACVRHMFEKCIVSSCPACPSHTTARCDFSTSTFLESGRSLNTT